MVKLEILKPCFVGGKMLSKGANVEVAEKDAKQMLSYELAIEVDSVQASPVVEKPAAKPAKK